MTPLDINIETGIAQCGGDKEFYADVLEASIEEDKRGELINAFNEENWELYTIVVHALKGTMRLFGALGAGNLAEKLQFAGEKSDIDYIKANNDEFINVMDESIEYIKSNI